MSKELKVNSGSGCSLLLTGTFLVFLVMKLIGKIDWSWWWVTAPLWGPASLALGCCFLAAPLVVIAALLKKGKK